MGWQWFRLEFSQEDGCLVYENGQGEKRIDFGIKKNIFGCFPQQGYSDEYGNRHQENGFLYKAAVSAGWLEEQKLQLRIQVIDRYFGILIMTFGFIDDKVSVCMRKSAEDFFNEYEGWLYGEEC